MKITREDEKHISKIIAVAAIVASAAAFMPKTDMGIATNGREIELLETTYTTEQLNEILRENELSKEPMMVILKDDTALDDGRLTTEEVDKIFEMSITGKDGENQNTVSEHDVRKSAQIESDTIKCIGIENNIVFYEKGSSQL